MGWVGVVVLFDFVIEWWLLELFARTSESNWMLYSVTLSQCCCFLRHSRLGSRFRHGTVKYFAFDAEILHSITWRQFDGIDGRGGQFVVEG